MPSRSTKSGGETDNVGQPVYVHTERVRDSDRPTRRPLVFWDRVKFLLLLVLLWLVLVWSDMANDPIIGFKDAAREQVTKSAWLLVLIGLEVLRQLHFIVAEHWAAYYRFWSRRGLRPHRPGQPPAERLDQVPDRARAEVAVLHRAAGADPGQGVSHLARARALPAARHDHPRAADHPLRDGHRLAGRQRGQFVAIFWFMSKGGVDVYFPDDISTRFSDVWGQDHVLERVKENMLFLEDPEAIEAKGGYVPGGILLWGPPGTGKTLMAEAVAGETGMPYVFVDPGAFINMFFGVGILKVKSLFRRLRKLAVRYGGVIVFFDEADSLGNRGGSVGGQGNFSPKAQLEACHGFCYLAPDTQAALFAEALKASPAPRPPGRFRQMIPAGMGGGGGMGTLQALLTEMSGLKKPRGFFNRIVRRTLGLRPKPPPKYRILIMMATNMPSALDEALLRPGRLDRVYRVGYPSKEGRRRTYEGYFSKVKCALTPEQVDHLATITPYATGATIKDLVNESLIVALREGRDTIIWTDVLKAKLLKSVGPSEGVEYIERERHAVALHEACHAVVSYRVQKRNVIDTATIQKGADYLGFVKPIPIEEQFTSWRNEYEADIMVSLASLVGERMFFDGDSSSGVSGDLQNATRIALAMEGLWGMGGQYGSYAVDPGAAWTRTRWPTARTAPSSRPRSASAPRRNLSRARRAYRHPAAGRTRQRAGGRARAGDCTRPSPARTSPRSSTARRGRSSTAGRTTTRSSPLTLEDYHQQVMVAHRGRDRSMHAAGPDAAGRGGRGRSPPGSRSRPTPTRSTEPRPAALRPG